MEQPKLTLVEGGRAKEANEVQARFAEYTKQVSIQCGEMAGFVIVAWDAEGTPTTSWKLGNNNPIPRMILPDVIHEMIKTEMYQR